MPDCNRPSENQTTSDQRTGLVLVSRVLARLSDRYAVDRKLGSGGTGVVYLARDVKLGRSVAIKVLHPEVANRVGAEAFQREIRLTASLQHPHILQVLDSGCVDGTFYYITPYMAEGSLRDLLEHECRLDVETAVRIATDVLEALERAHSHGIVHCDLKPENILLTNGHAILADFGIARYCARTGQRDPERISGSPEYMSPEQAAGEDQLDGRSDIFSLGCVLYEMIAGEPAFSGPHALAIIAKRFSGFSPNLRASNPAIPRGIAHAVRRSLSVNPNDRYPDPGSFAAALLRATVIPGLSRRRGFRKRGFRRAMARLTRSATITFALLLVG